MERMGVEYQRFDGKEYVSLKRYYNLLCKCKALDKENKKLKEFKGKREEIKFYFKALVERVEPINSKEAEELQRYRKLFEKLYREELYYLEKENKQLKECNLNLQEWIDNKENVNKSLREENSNLKDELQEWLNAVGNM